jgi:hypothetical protein
MAIPAEVKDVTVTTTVKFNRDGTTTPITRYTYFVGKHGPFYVDYPKGQDTPETVSAAMQVEVDKLKALGIAS